MELSVHAIRFYEKEGLFDSRHVQREKITIESILTKLWSVYR